MYSCRVAVVDKRRAECSGIFVGGSAGHVVLYSCRIAVVGERRAEIPGVFVAVTLASRAFMS